MRLITPVNVCRSSRFNPDELPTFPVHITDIICREDFADEVVEAGAEVDSEVEGETIVSCGSQAQV